MLVASRATAGPAPRCIECGAPAHFIDLNASWKPSCGHYADLVTVERLEAEVRWAREALQKAEARLADLRRVLAMRSAPNKENG